MCVSMGEMTTGFPAALTTCSARFPLPSSPQFYPTWLLYLDTHVVLSGLAALFVVNGHAIQASLCMAVGAPCGVPAGESGTP